MTGSTTCAIVGGGPAGIMLGLLLSRAGIDVTVLEKHPDFLRDFRGDTVHPTTQVVLEQLSLTDAFQRIVRGRVRTITMGRPEHTLLHAEVATAAPRARFREIALAPQWDLLDLLVNEAQRSPHFHLKMAAECTGSLIEPTGAVTGVTYRDTDGEHALRAVLTVAADGRDSKTRDAIGSASVDLGAPMDVLWFRISRKESDGDGLQGMLGQGEIAIAIDRGDYWQVAQLIPKGSFETVREAGLESFRARVTELLPFTAGRTGEIAGWGDVKTLNVGLARLRRWHGRGILAIGDAAHTMSPIGGVGINLAVQDAVAAANELAGPLLRAQHDPDRFSKTLNPLILARIGRRRLLPTVLTQALQRIAQRRVIGSTLGTGSPRIPFLIAADLRNNGLIARLLVRVLVYGVRPERIRSPAILDS